MSKAQRAFAVLLPQDMRIGARTLGHISFVTPMSVERNVPPMEADGLLPTLLFQRSLHQQSPPLYGLQSEVKCISLASRERSGCRRINHSS